MIIGFGFGGPLTALLMLAITSVISYMFYRKVIKSKDNYYAEGDRREQLREYYYRQRDRARELTREYDLTDEEIEQRIDEELQK